MSMDRQSENQWAILTLIKGRIAHLKKEVMMGQYCNALFGHSIKKYKSFKKLFEPLFEYYPSSFQWDQPIRYIK